MSTVVKGDPYEVTIIAFALAERNMNIDSNTQC